MGNELKGKIEEKVELYRNKEIDKESFNNQIDLLIANEKTPLKDFYKIYSIIYKVRYNVPRDMRYYLFEISNELLESSELDFYQKQIVKCVLLNAYFFEYKYEKSEKYCQELLNESISDDGILLTLANYLTKTRRYEKAKEFFNQLINNNKKYETHEDYLYYKGIIDGNKKEYYPATISARNDYIIFLEKIGIEIEEIKCGRSSKQPNKIAKEDYPVPKETNEEGFLNFVAFDVETTGLNPSMDAITEIGAIKVIDGKVVEEKEFIFQELVKPYKKRIPPDVEEKTGISNEMVSNARKIWDVFNDFADFIGDNILLGYNCMLFDSKFLVRAGRLSNRIIYNEYYDVMHLVNRYKYKLSIDSKTLVEVGNKLGINNPQAHRALSDAITTAKVYLEIIHRAR